MPKKKFEEKKMSLADAVSTAFGEITSLGEEMREAFDNTPESLQQSGVGEARGEAADNLENISEIDVPDILQDTDAKKFEVTWSEPVRTAKQAMKLSRSARRDDALMMLDACVEFLNELADKESESEEIRDAAKELSDELENAKGEIEAVEFPGMFG